VTRERSRPEDAREVSIEVLIERHEGELLRYAIRLIGDRALVEDVVQEAFLAWVRATRGGTAIDDSIAWLYRVVRNRARDAKRREIRVHKREAAVATLDRGCADVDALERDERCDAISRLLGGLDEMTREVLQLSVVDGKSYRQIAEITGVSLGTVANRVHRGLSRISGGLRAAGVL
jgi:RNA polymerase sigma factor (sigma-70 family)